MARKHKAATQVTIASTSDRSGFHEWVERWWKLAAALAVAISFAILVSVWLEQRSRREVHESWERLAAVVPLEGFVVQLPSTPALAGLVEDLEGSRAWPWAQALHMSGLAEEGEIEAAIAASEELRSAAPNHPLVSMPVRFGEDGDLAALPGHVTLRLEDLRRWRRDLPATQGPMGPVLPPDLGPGEAEGPVPPPAGGIDAGAAEGDGEGGDAGEAHDVGPPDHDAEEDDEGGAERQPPASELD